MGTRLTVRRVNMGTRLTVRRVQMGTRLTVRGVKLETVARRAMAAEEKENQEKDTQPKKIKRKIDFSDLRNPKKNLRRCLARSQILGHSQKTKEQQSRDGDEVERCLPRNT